MATRPGSWYEAVFAARNGAARTPDPDLIANALLARKEWFNRLLDPRRDIAAECGHPAHDTAVDAWTYQQLYDRDAIAARVVEVYPRESWQVQPLVYESEDADTVTPFEAAWDEMGHGLLGEKSFYKREEGSPVWEYLLRADILSGVGQYGIVLLGIDDGLPLDQPAEPGEGRKLLYLRCFPEALAPVARYENNPADRRFGQPLAYNVTFNDPNSAQGGEGVDVATREVHWSRVIHVADNLQGSEIFGRPRMQAVLNRLLDLGKLYGGSAEMYWRGAFPGLALETNPALGGDVEVNQQDLRDMMEQYANGLQRYLALMGMSARTLSPTVVDPTSQIAVHLEAIAVQLDIPIRIFKGSERGELASSQDERKWRKTVAGRQRNYLTPRLIIPFVDRLILLGVLPEPKEFCVEWPDLGDQTEAEQAAVAGAKTGALAQYVAGGVEALIPPLDYLTRFMGMTEEEAEAVLENAAELAEQRMEEDMAMREEEIERGLARDPTDPAQNPAAGPPRPYGGEEEEEEEEQPVVAAQFFPPVPVPPTWLAADKPPPVINVAAPDLRPLAEAIERQTAALLRAVGAREPVTVNVSSDAAVTEELQRGFQLVGGIFAGAIDRLATALMSKIVPPLPVPAPVVEVTPTVEIPRPPLVGFEIEVDAAGNKRAVPFIVESGEG